MTRMRRSFFGGAIQGILPSSVVDASSIRHVPNNQEVFIHSDSDQSIIIELLERVDEVSDENSIKYHFDALAEANDAQQTENHLINRIEQIPINLLNIERLSSAWFLFGQQKISKYNEQARNSVNIYLCLLRLSGDLSTDILLSFNDPVFVNCESSSSQQQSTSSRWSMEDFQNFCRSIVIIDYNLFVTTSDQLDNNSNEFEMN